MLQSASHSQKTTNPEVIHNPFWSSPTTPFQQLRGKENLALVTDGDFGVQAQNVGK
jgi:hypothetical protein